MNVRFKAAIQHWSYVAPVLQPARNEKEYAALVEALNAAIDAGGADEKYPLARLVEYLGDLVAEYEAKDKMPPAATGAEVLRYLMQRDNLRQIDLPELGSQGVVSELLSGRRDFNARQAKALAARFGVSAVCFECSSRTPGYLTCSRSILTPTILQLRIACNLATLTLTHGALKSLRMICAMCSARVSSNEKCPSLSTVWMCCATCA